MRVRIKASERESERERRERERGGEGEREMLNRLNSHAMWLQICPMLILTLYICLTPFPLWLSFQIPPYMPTPESGWREYYQEAFHPELHIPPCSYPPHPWQGPPIENGTAQPNCETTTPAVVSVMGCSPSNMLGGCVWYWVSEWVSD